MNELKPCPFCGGKATVKESGYGHQGGGDFLADYKIGCEKCRVFFEETSVFHLEKGAPVFDKNGYELAKEKWNRRNEKGGCDGQNLHCKTC